MPLLTLPIARVSARVSCRRSPWAAARKCARSLQTSASSQPGAEGEGALCRSCLYVPASNPRMLRKSLSTPADLIIYDLEDSVAPAQKAQARSALVEFLRAIPPGGKDGEQGIGGKELAVRINAVDTEGYEQDVLAAASQPLLTTLVLPKVHSAQHLTRLAEALSSAPSLTQPGQTGTNGQRRGVIASIESARGMWDVGEIAGWKGDARVGLRGLLFAAEDYCADTGIVRTPGRRELYYPRARMATAAKAYGLLAIDMVCVDYKDQQTAQDEAREAREMGYDGKQAIHPSQVEIYNTTFLPSPQEVARATAILRGMQQANEERGAGAFGLEVGGRVEMIDEPMVKQARGVLERARRGGMDVPDI